MKIWLIGSGIVLVCAGIVGGIEGAMIQSPIAVAVSFGTGILMESVYIAVTWRQLYKAVGEL